MKEDKKDLNELDNQKLMDELDGLDDDENSKKAQVRGKLKKNKENIIIVIILIVVVGIVLYYYNYKDDSEYSDEYYEDYRDINEDVYDYEVQEQIRKSNFETQKQNIQIVKQSISINNELILNMTNQNNEDITNILVYVVYYDESNKIIDIKKQYIDYFKANSSRFLKFEELPKNQVRYEIFITKEDFYDESYKGYYLNDYISVANELKNGEINITLKNNYTEEINCVGFSIVYYDLQDNILDVKETYIYDIKSGDEERIIDSGIWNDEKNELVSYARYEVILNEAYSY